MLPTHAQNPLTEPMVTILQRLVTLNGLLHLAGNQLENFRNLFTRGFNQQDIPIDRAFAGFALILEDLATPSDQRYLDHVHAGAFTREGQAYLDAANEILGGWQAWTAAQCFESLEGFLRSTAAAYFMHFSPDAHVGNLSTIPIARTDPAAWAAHFRARQWNVFTLLELFRAVAPAIRQSERDNHLHFDLADWVFLLAEVRHAVVHSNSDILRRRLLRRRSDMPILLPSFFSGSWIGDTYSVALTGQQAIRTIQITGSYAHMVFTYLSNLHGLSSLLPWETQSPPA